VHFLAKEDGAFAARIQTDKTSVMAQPVSLGESTLMVQTSGGGLYAVSLK